MSRRRGFTLIEMLLALALTAMTFTTVLVALHGVFRSETNLRAEVRNDLDLSRLAAQFRTDAHEATSVHPGEEASLLVFRLAADQSAEYRLTSRRVERLQRRGSQIERQETYAFPKALKPQWQIATEGASPRASLVLEPDASEAPGPLAPRPVRIDAAVGLIHPLVESSNR